MSEHTTENDAPVRRTASTLPLLLDIISVAVADSGRTQRELAHQVGLSEKHVSQMMTGRVIGSLRSWQALMDAAGISMTATIRVIPPGSDAHTEQKGGTDG